MIGSEIIGLISGGWKRPPLKISIEATCE